MIDDYKKIYDKIYSKINLEKVLLHYNIDYKSYHGGKGKEYLCSCPFHDDSTPSFSIIHNNGVYNCFVCGGGDFVKFIKNLEKFSSIKETLEFLKKQVGLQETVDIFSIVQNSTNVFIQNSKEEKTNENEEFKEITLPKS